MRRIGHAVVDRSERQSAAGLVYYAAYDEQGIRICAY
jgi:hypothetical protein